MTPVSPLLAGQRPESSDAAGEARRAPSPAFAAELSRARPGAQLVAPRRTPLTGEQAALVLQEAWAEVVGESPDRATVSILAAHWAHETGNGEAMLNFNFGGIKGTGPTGLGAAYGTREGWGPTEVRTVDTFRAYESPDEGARDYVSLLARRYPTAVEAARAGDPEAFVRALKERGYFTGNEEAYVRNVTALSRQGLALGWDAMGGPGRAAFAPVLENAAHRRMDSGSPAFVPFESMSMDLGTARIDGAALYDAVTRATLRIASDSGDDAQDRDSHT